MGDKDRKLLEHFARIDRILDTIEAHLDRFEGRVDEVCGHMAVLVHEMKAIGERLEGMDARLARIEQRLGTAPNDETRNSAPEDDDDWRSHPYWDGDDRRGA